MRPLARTGAMQDRAHRRRRCALAKFAAQQGIGAGERPKRCSRLDTKDVGQVRAVALQASEPELHLTIESPHAGGLVVVESSTTSRLQLAPRRHRALRRKGCEIVEWRFNLPQERASRERQGQGNHSQRLAGQGLRSTAQPADSVDCRCSPWRHGRC